MKFNCLLVGAGQLGSRYLQGLQVLEGQLSITVVDPSSASLDAARLRLAEVAATTSHDVKFTTSLEHVPKQLDLALVVTPAQCRADVVAAIIHDMRWAPGFWRRCLLRASSRWTRLKGFTKAPGVGEHISTADGLAPGNKEAVACWQPGGISGASVRWKLGPGL